MDLFLCVTHTFSYKFLTKIHILFMIFLNPCYNRNNHLIWITAGAARELTGGSQNESKVPSLFQERQRTPDRIRNRRVMQCVCDQIPPAYPCEGEKVVFIGVEMNGKLPGAVDHFCKDLNPTRAKGVAFYVLNSNGNTDGLSSIIDTMKKNGVETYGEPLGIAVKGGLFKKGMPTDADTKKVLEWADKIAKM